jgi:hypothetical protein
LTLAGGAVLVSAGSAAMAQSAPGVAYSTSYLALSPSSAVVIRPLDDTRANLALKRRFAEALRTRAVRVEERDTPYVLSFETEVDHGIRRGAPSLGSVSGSASGSAVDAQSASGLDAEVRINVWASNQDSLLGGRIDDLATRGTLRYVLRATLEEEPTGRRLWQGEASYAGAPADEGATLAAMASVLAGQFGRTVRPRSFRLE